MAIQGDGKQTTERSDQVKASSLALSLLYSTQNLIHRLRNSLRIVLGVEPPTNSPRLDGNANPLKLSGDSIVLALPPAASQVILTFFQSTLVLPNRYALCFPLNRYHRNHPSQTTRYFC